MQDGNIVFSPYGIASVSVLLFEGAAGNTAYEILRVLNLPWDTLLARIGFRDLNRHLKVGILICLCSRIYSRRERGIYGMITIKVIFHVSLHLSNEHSSSQK